MPWQPGPHALISLTQTLFCALFAMTWPPNAVKQLAQPAKPVLIVIVVVQS